MLSRATLRTRLRAQRRGLDPVAREHYTEQITRHLCHDPVFRTSRRIALYWASDGEVALHAIARRAWAMGKQVFLPVLFGPHNHLRFAPYFPHSIFSKNCFGIPEPRVPRSCLMRGISLDLVMVPLVGCDDTGARLGRGGGYYDRSFAARQRRQFWRKPRLVGVAFELQRVPRFNRQSWDVALDGLVSEKQLHWFRG